MKRSTKGRQAGKGGHVMEMGLIALGAGLAIGLAALATGLAQARIGAAVVGALLEKPESLGTMIILLVIPETLVIFGFTIAILILTTLK
jgi:V/A-type H+/Na+-transporting ATPase subunit K